MDESTEKLIDSLKYLNADDVKKLQTKLTKTANSILNDGLSYKLEPFYSEDEQKTLKAAANILFSIKNRVEHVKEIKARKEKADRARYDEFCRKRNILLAKVFPTPPNDPHQYRNILIWHLAAVRFLRATTASYLQAVRYVLDDMHRWSVKEDPLCSTETVQRSVMHWQYQLIEDLKFYAFPENELVDNSWTRVKSKFEGEWRSTIEAEHADLIKTLDIEVAALNADNVTKIRTINKPTRPGNR